ncbi:MAG: nitroreductase family protein [Oscillospiraceae bacterium]|nr:nitroreductase family protein [Oscillospiraceae bacterium]
MTNEVLDCLETRRSIRKFSKEQVGEEQLEAILKAGTYAPTGAGLQSPVIVCVQNPEEIEILSRLNAQAAGMNNMDPFYGAPTVVVILSDKTVCPSYFEDGILVAGNILNAAHSVCVDSCFIFRARETFETEEGMQLREKWGLNENFVGVANIILGYRDCEEPKCAPRKENYIIRR